MAEAFFERDPWPDLPFVAGSTLDNATRLRAHCRVETSPLRLRLGSPSKVQVRPMDIRLYLGYRKPRGKDDRQKDINGGVGSARGHGGGSAPSDSKCTALIAAKHYGNPGNSLTCHGLDPNIIAHAASRLR